MTMSLLSYQILYLVYTYLTFSTESRYSFLAYDMKDSKHSINEFPAITVCTEQIFEELRKRQQQQQQNPQ